MGRVFLLGLGVVAVATVLAATSYRRFDRNFIFDLDDDDDIDWDWNW